MRNGKGSFWNNTCENAAAADGPGFAEKVFAGGVMLPGSGRG